MPIPTKPTSARIPGADSDLRRAFDHIDSDLNHSAPWSGWQRIPVTFNSTANADTIIKHNLEPPDPETVEWLCASVSLMAAPGTIPVVYRDSAAAAKPWGANYIVLRSNVASLQATLILLIPRVVSSASRR